MAKINRGDVLIVRVFERGRPKVRPVVVIQNDRNNKRLTNLVVAMISSNVSLADKEETQVLVDLSLAENLASGLDKDSAIKCENLYTILKRDARTIGRFSSDLMKQVDKALRIELNLL